MRDNEKPPMTGERAAALLADILKWKLLLTTPEPGVRSVPTDTDGIRSPNRDALPFGLDQVIDTTWADGPSGTTTEAGVDKWLRFWTPWFSYWVSQRARYRTKPGPWMLRELLENPVFLQLEDWLPEDVETWREFTSELHLMWVRLRAGVGEAPLVRSLCPKCRDGWMLSYYRRWRSDGSGGLQDIAVCSQCSAVIDYTHDEHLASARAALRELDVPEDRYLTLAEVQAVWGAMVKPGTLRRWVHEGKVAKRDGKYRLMDINRVQYSKVAGIIEREGTSVMPEVADA